MLYFKEEKSVFQMLNIPVLFNTTWSPGWSDTGIELFCNFWKRAPCDQFPFYGSNSRQILYLTSGGPVIDRNIIFDLRGPCHWQKYYIWPHGALLSLTEILYLTSGGPPVIDRVLIAETLGPVIDRVLIAESLGPVIDRVLIVDTWGGCHLQSTHRRDLGHHGGGALSYLITVYSTLLLLLLFV